MLQYRKMFFVTEAYYDESGQDFGREVILCDQEIRQVLKRSDQIRLGVPCFEFTKDKAIDLSGQT